MSSLRFSFRDNLSFVGGGNIVRAVTFSLRGTLVSTRVLFSAGLSRANAPVHRQTLAFGQRRSRTEEFEEEGSKEDGEKAVAKRRKVPKSQYIVLHLHEDKLPRWLR